MKKILLLSLLCLSVVQAKAQDTLQFTAVLTNPVVLANGVGTFSLTDDLFTYYVMSPSAGFRAAAIHGPALPGMEAPVIFSLNRIRCDFPGPAGPGFCEFAGSFNLTEGQAQQLINEQWYVTAIPPTAPPLAMRGQITVVPEPLATTLLATGVGLWLLHSICRCS